MASPSSRPVAIITGAASGMGAALATHLVKSGWHVACVDINAKLGRELTDSLAPYASFFQANVSSYASQASMFDAVWRKWHRLDALCANAGIVDRSSIYILKHKKSEQVPPEPDLSCTDIVYKGVIYGTQLATHYMRQNTPPGGKIVATGSVVALYPHSTYPEYSGAKAGVLQFMRTSAPVLKIKDDVNFNVVLPGIVPTAIIPKEMVEAVRPDFLTPIATIVKAYEKFLSDDGLWGQAVECSVDRLIFSEQPGYLDGAYSKRATTVWDPLFQTMHHESSQLPDAIR